MTALMRYRLATLLHSQRYVAPVLLLLAAIVVGTANAYGPLLPLYALCAGAQFVVAAWLTTALVNLESPEQRAITIVNAGRSRDLLAATVGVAVACSAVLTVIGVLLPLALGSHTITALVLVMGAGAQFVCALAGIAVGVLCSRLVIARPGVAVLVALALVMALLLVPGLPPVNSLLRAAARARQPLDLVWPVIGSASLALVLLLVVSVLAQRFDARQQ